MIRDATQRKPDFQRTEIARILQAKFVVVDRWNKPANLEVSVLFVFMILTVTHSKWFCQEVALMPGREIS